MMNINITKNMTRIEADHDLAMEKYQDAMFARSQGREDEAISLYSEAADIEYRLSIETKDFYPTQIILAKSAAALALNAKRYDFVRHIASEYLLNPQPKWTEYHAEIQDCVDNIPKGLSL